MWTAELSIAPYAACSATNNNIKLIILGAVNFIRFNRIDRKTLDWLIDLL